MTETDSTVTNLIERYLATVADDDYERFGELLTDVSAVIPNNTTIGQVLNAGTSPFTLTSVTWRCRTISRSGASSRS